MNKIRITTTRLERWLRDTSEIPGEHVLHDADAVGLRLRRRNGGAASWSWFGRVKGAAKPMTLTIGPVEALTIEEARDRARTARAQATGGTSPRQDRTAADRLTLREACRMHFDSGRVRERTRAEYERVLKLHLAKVADKPLVEVDLDKLTEVYRLTAAKSASQAKKALSLVGAARKAAFASTEDERLVRDLAPFIKRRVHVEQPPARLDAVIRPEQLPAWWSAMRDESGAIRDALQLMLLSGMRKSELLALKWAEVDLRAGLLTLEADRTKSARKFTKPLGKRAAALLRARKLVVGRSQWVFPSPDPDSKTGHLSDVQWAQDRILKRCAVWASPHALRRTFVTVGRTVATREDVARLVGHSALSITDSAYNADDAANLARIAQTIEEKILALAEPATHELPREAANDA